VWSSSGSFSSVVCKIKKNHITFGSAPFPILWDIIQVTVSGATFKRGKAERKRGGGGGE